MAARSFARDDIKSCAICRNGVMHAGNPLGLFWRVSAERLMMDRQAVAREHGLEMMMSGNVALARAFSPNRTLAEPLHPPREMLICEACVMDSGSLIAAFMPEDESP